MLNYDEFNKKINDFDVLKEKLTFVLSFSGWNLNLDNELYSGAIKIKFSDDEVCVVITDTAGEDPFSIKFDSNKSINDYLDEINLILICITEELIKINQERSGLN